MSHLALARPLQFTQCCPSRCSRESVTQMATQTHITESYPFRSWKEIAEEASKEQDNVKLMKLTDELLDALCKDFD
jgi:hypothetical protein